MLSGKEFEDKVKEALDKGLITREVQNDGVYLYKMTAAGKREMAYELYNKMKNAGFF